MRRLTLAVGLALSCARPPVAPFDAGAEPDAGDDAGHEAAGDAGTDAGADAGSDGGLTCGGPRVDLGELARQSSERLAVFFGTDGGFEGGELYFRDVAAGVPGCPIYDITAVVYVAPMASSLMPAEAVASLTDAGRKLVVEYDWGLDGYRQILFNVRQSEFGELPLGQIAPLSFVVTLAPGTPSGRAQQIRDALTAAAGEVPVDLLDQLGMVTVGPRVNDENSLDVDGLTEVPYHQSVLAAAAAARAVPEVRALDWSFVTYAFDLDQGPLLRLDGGVICPDALREVRPRLEAQGNVFASQSSLPPPFGTGWHDNPDLQRCGH